MSDEFSHKVEHIKGFMQGAEWADAHEEPEVHVVECRGGCARVFDKPRPDPFFICRQCRIRMGQDF